MALSPEQRRVAQAFARAIRKRNASPRLAEALYEAGITESNLRNVPAGQGDRDSVGALQQRPSQGWRGLGNPYKAALEFLDHGQRIQAQGFKGSSGSLAQAIQRSAYPDRYETHDDEAESLIARFLGGKSSTGPGRAGGGRQPSTATGSTLLPPGFNVTPGPDTTGLLASLLTADRATPPPAGQLRSSPTAAQAVLPQGYRGIQTSGGPAPRRDMAAVLEAVQGLGTALPGVTPGEVVGDAQNGGNGTGRPGSGSTKRRGRPKSGLGNAVSLVDSVIGDYGAPITAKQEPGHQAGGDHDPAVKGATARDIGGDERTREAIFRDITRRLGVKGARYKGEDINVTVGGVRYQIISRDHGTGPHLHVGMRRV